MIANVTAEGWEIFYHRAHALLAAQIGLHLAWQVGERPARLAETLAAIFQHDDLVLEWDSELIGPAGTPLDFTLQAGLQAKASAEIDLQPQIKLVEHALYRGRWVAMLVSMHCCFLLKSRQEKPREMQKFLKEQCALQQGWQRELGIAPTIADQAYALMQWCDRMSLILCKRELPSRERWLEVSMGPDGRRYDAQQREDGTINVRPWPFSTPAFTADAEMVHLAQPVFKNNDELIAAMRAAPVKTIEWQFVQDDAHAKGRFDRKRYKHDKARALPNRQE